MKDSVSTEYERVLDLIEDYFVCGFRRERVHHPHTVRASTGRFAQRPTVQPTGRQRQLDAVAAEVAVCTMCPLHTKRTNAVPGSGSIDPIVVVVGEAPGKEEDRTGKPFVGAAGKYLDKWLAAIQLSRETDCFIANVVKCRPPGNRDPESSETDVCVQFLERQIDILGPKAILTLGRIASHILTGQSVGIGKLRGSVYSYRGIPLVPTFHPSAVLRDMDLRRRVWDDLKLLKSVCPD